MRFAKRISLDSIYLVLGLPLGIAAFTWEVTGWSVSLGLLIVWVGLPLAALTILGSRLFAVIERRRAALLFGAPLRARYLPLAGGLWARLKTLLRDGQTWRDLAWNLLLLPFGVAGFCLLAGAVYLTLVGLTLPIWWGWPSEHQIFVGYTVNNAGRAWISFAIGLASIPLTLSVIRATAAGTGALARALLEPRRDEELQERVEQLDVRRAGAVDSAAADLERIERDLHDGAQAQLVALALDLGRAEEKLAAGDAEGARTLVQQARDGARNANADLRNLARGIRPPLLADRGLEAAVRELAARSPIPALVSVDVVERPAPVAETAAYFVVAEALTNAAKHSGSAQATVRLTRLGDRLEVEVRDDGTGDADPEGSGLRGLRRRVEALDGTLTLTSPSGGPTIVRAELPCGS